ncbi:hypothetical protein [Marinimicrobium agarilyticum]|uniref:hypothetical protein n=1 Tax=Marinimicrobium agarilyticum TaxID=306546 RepID=UPI0004821D95|nr:hypothetical protein [Marinimicrobium agarilyticum]
MSLSESQMRAFERLDNHETAFRSEEGQLYSELTKLVVDLIAANKEMENIIALNEHATTVKPKTKADHIEYARSFLVLTIVFAYMKNESLAKSLLNLSPGQHFAIQLFRNNVAHEGLLIPTNAATFKRDDYLLVYSGFAIANSNIFEMAGKLTDNGVQRDIKRFKTKSPDLIQNKHSCKEEAFRSYISGFSCGKYTFTTPLLCDIYFRIESQIRGYLKTDSPDLLKVRDIRIKEGWRTVEDFLDRLGSLDQQEFPVKSK